MSTDQQTINLSAILAALALQRYGRERLQRELSSPDSKEAFLNVVCNSIKQSREDINLELFRTDFAQRLMSAS